MRRWMLVAAGILTVGALGWIFLRPEKDPAKRVGELWAKRGIDKPNIILFTLDTTRADHIACYGYPDVRTPNLDALAARGVLFEQAAASSPLTLPSHSSIMTGMYPTYHGVRVNGNNGLSEEQTTIAEVLSGRGYQTGAFIGSFVLDGRWGLKQGFQCYDDPFDLKKYKHVDLGAIQRPGNQVMDAALAWLDGAKANPFFAWIHLYDPHAPYEPPEPYHSEYNSRGRVGLYDGEIAFMDEQIGRCVSWLQKNGLDKNTVLILIGDHGEGLGSHGEGTHGYFIYEYAVHIPLIVVTPFEKLRGLRIPSQVRAVDVFPTLLEMAKIKAPSKTQGRSLLPLIFHPQKKEESYAYGESMAPNIQFGWSALRSLRTTHYKYIDAPKAELYDLIPDAAEQTNLIQQYPDLVRSMKGELDRLVAETSQGAPTPQAANLDKDTMERLTALGYIGAPVTAKKTSGSAAKVLADPKDKLSVYLALTTAGELIMKDRYAEAAATLESALREEPTIPQGLVQLATCYVELGRTEEAKAKLDLVLKDDPQNAQALICLANILLDEQKREDVIALCKRTLSVDERSVQAYVLLGEVYTDEQNHAQALPYLEKAVEIQPKLTRNRLNLAACLVGLKQYDRAEKLLKEIIQESPTFLLANFNLGLLYEEEGKLDRAGEAYAQEVASHPTNFKARFNLGKVLFKLGDRAGSIEQMREAIKINPKLAEGYFMLAMNLLNEPSPLDEVRGLVEKGLSLADTSELKALGYFLLADIYNREQQPEKMNDALKKANSYRSKKE
jgi:arylsulfatase A-like enzyme/tetratricopeptide (TPR) repeat protein